MKFEIGNEVYDIEAKNNKGEVIDVDDRDILLPFLIKWSNGKTKWRNGAHLRKAEKIEEGDIVTAKDMDGSHLEVAYLLNKKDKKLNGDTVVILDANFNNGETGDYYFSSTNKLKKVADAKAEVGDKVKAKGGNFEGELKYITEYRDSYNNDKMGLIWVEEAKEYVYARLDDIYKV